MKNILEKKELGLKTLKKLNEYLKITKVNGFTPARMLKFKEESGLTIWYSKDYFNTFNLAYHINHTREREEFNVNTIEELKEQVESRILLRENEFEKAQKTLAEKNSIEVRLKMSIKLTKELDYTNYNSEIVSKISYNLKDSFYLADRLK